MKTTTLAISFAIAALTSACSSMQLPGSADSAKSELSTTGPTVLNARAEPGTIELNQDLQPQKPAEILADVKDFRAQVRDVKLQFTHVPIEVPMANVGGTTWRAELSPRQLQMLAVSGRTIRYEANVVASSSNGQTAQIGMSKSPVAISIKAPDLSQNAKNEQKEQSGQGENPKG